MLADRSVIEIDQVSKVYRHGWVGKGVHALEDVSFKVLPGQIFGLLGPNGAGKTTLIKVLLGIIRATSGKAKLLDFSAGDRRGRIRVGYLPEHLRLARHQTARTALELYGKLSGLSNAQITERRDELLKTVGLEGRDQESVRRFSKGMQQRLGIAQALIHDPELLILDEPTDGLDPVGRSQIRQLLQQLKQSGKTVFLNSHLLQEVELVCDHVAILDHGQLKFVGTMEELSPPDSTDLMIHAAGAETDVRAAVEGEPELQIEPLKDGGFLLQVTVHDQSNADRLVDQLRHHQVSIVRLNRRKKTLEDAFLELISQKAELV